MMPDAGDELGRSSLVLLIKGKGPEQSGPFLVSADERGENLGLLMRLGVVYA